MFTIVYPLITKISGKTIDFSSLLQKEEYVDTSYISMGDKLIDNTNAQIEETYLDSIKKEITNTIENMGYKIYRLDIEIETKNEDQYGRINKINLRLIDNKEETHDEMDNQTNEQINKNIANDIDRVDNININVNIQNATIKQNNNSSEESKITKEEVEEIKNNLVNTFNVKKEAINIES